MFKTLKATAAIAAVATLAACAAPTTHKVAVTAQPSAAPARTITNFSASLRCMDDLFLSSGAGNIVLTTAGIPDATGRIGGGTKDMLISSILAMSARSGALTYVDFDPAAADVALLQENLGFTESFRFPDFYIRGAVTQLDESVVGQSAGGGVSFMGNSLGASAEQISSVIAIDMNVGELASRQIIPGITANNSIVITQQGANGELGASIGSVGVVFNIAMNQADGPHQALRTLIELSAIELVGKLMQVPYWTCLEVDATNPKVMVEARDWFDSKGDKDRVTFVQQALAGNGYYAGEASGQIDEATRNAVIQYQLDNDLITSGQIDFDTYFRLISAGNGGGATAASRPAPQPAAAQPAAAQPAAVQPAAAQPAAAQPAGQAAEYVTAEAQPAAYVPAAEQQVPPQLSLIALADGAGIYQVGDKLQAALSLDDDAFVYCYYQDGQGQVVRLFPNRFSPNAFVPAGSGFVLPDNSWPFSLVLDRAGATEQLACMASKQEIGLDLPEALKVEDLTPMPVASIMDLYELYNQIDPATLAAVGIEARVY